MTPKKQNHKPDIKLRKRGDVRHPLRDAFSEDKTGSPSGEKPLKEAFEDLEKHPEKYPNLPDFIKEARKRFGIEQDSKGEMKQKKQNHSQENRTLKSGEALSVIECSPSGSPSGEKPLSEKIIFEEAIRAFKGSQRKKWIEDQDVKQAVKRLKEEFNTEIHLSRIERENKIDKIFGEFK